LSQQFSKIKIYNAMAVLILLYGSKILTLRKKNKTDCHHSRSNFSETAGYTLVNHKRNEEILDELKVEPDDEKLRRYKSNWL